MEMIAQAGSGQLNKESYRRSELLIRWTVINEETDTTCTNKHLNHARRYDSVSSKSKALSFNLNILTPSYAEYVWVLGVSPEQNCPTGGQPGPHRGQHSAPHTPHTTSALLLPSAGLVCFGFVLKEEVAKRLQITINQEAKNPELEMFDCFHYMC